MIVLSSSSPIRRQLLTQSGLTFKTAKPPINEDLIKAKCRADKKDAVSVAEILAESKAVGVADILPGAFVIGADQMLDCDGEWFDKPTDLAAARAQLRALRGRTHCLISAVALVGEGKTLWKFQDRASMTMRDFSDNFLDHYLEKSGDAILGSVGAYKLESMGAQLFERIEGDYFTILGLPLIPLLGALRQAGAIPS
jgi:septum formation protein